MKEEINIIFKGVANFELKEGDNIIVTGHLINNNDKKTIMATSYNTNHSMELENWQDSISKERR